MPSLIRHESDVRFQPPNLCFLIQNLRKPARQKFLGASLSALWGDFLLAVAIDTDVFGGCSHAIAVIGSLGHFEDLVAEI